MRWNGDFETLLGKPWLAELARPNRPLLFVLSPDRAYQLPRDCGPEVVSPRREVMVEAKDWNTTTKRGRRVGRQAQTIPMATSIKLQRLGSANESVVERGQGLDHFL